MLIEERTIDSDVMRTEPRTAPSQRARRGVRSPRMSRQALWVGARTVLPRVHPPGPRIYVHTPARGVRPEKGRNVLR